MRKSGAGGSGPDSPSAAWPHVDSFVPDLGRPSWARGGGGGGGSVLPGPFKSPRPEEQCAPFPTPPVRGQSGSFRGPLSLLSVRRASASRGPRAVSLSAQALWEREAAQDAAGFAQLPATGPLRTVRGGSGM